MAFGTGRDGTAVAEGVDMGRRLHTVALAWTRLVLFASALAVLTPAPAQAEDIWCRLFGAGCGGGGGSASQSTTQRDVPEIDPGTLASGIALAAGGAAILRDRVRRRR
jgi:hypothetical protein